ncbi:MAG: ATP-binding protein [Bacteriovoracaceae bacterium]
MILRFIKAFLLIGFCIAAQLWLTNYFHAPFITLLYPATFFIAWRWGFRPAIFAIFISMPMAVYFNYPPIFSFKGFGQTADLVRFIIFGCSSLATAYVVSQGERWRKEFSSMRGRFTRSTSAINLGVWYCDLPFDKLIWDKNTKEHFWLPENADVTIDTFYERIHPDDREKTRKAIEKSIADRGAYDIEYRTVNPHDPSKIKFIRAIGWTDYNEKNEPVRFDGITIDNSQLRHTDLRLNESLEVVETINRVGTFLSGELDQKKLVQQVTDAATQLARAEFGAFFYNLINEKGESYTLYTVSGVPIENFTKFPMPRNTAIFAPTFAGTEIVRSDDITKDPRYGKNDPYFGMPRGHLPVVSYLAVPVISRSGEVIGGLFLGHKKFGVFTDREERIVAGLAAQIAIAMDNARLFEKEREAIRIRDEFMSISSHELKTPLTSLKMQLQLFSHLLKQPGPVPQDKIQKTVEISERQVNRLNALVEDLLDVTRISSGKLSLSIEELNLAEVVHEVAERYRPMLAQNKCTLNVHAPDKLKISADRLRLEQVLVNLVTNSMKYAPGSLIEIKLSEEAAEAVLTVKDNGPGIKKEDQTRVFQRFERVTTKSAQVGLGLGLYIVHQIVEAHNGSILLRSEKGEGVEFTIRLPI